MKNIFIIPNTKKDGWEQAVYVICEKIKSLGGNPILDTSNKDALSKDLIITFCDFDNIADEIDMIISLGGDGTLLAIAKRAAKLKVPVLGINIGHLGYLVELDIDETEELEKVFLGEYTYDSRDMLDITVIRDCELAAHFTALNEALVSKGEISRLIKLDFFADGRFINSYTADGLIIATPTGSTAYSLSAGGPVIEPRTKSVVIIPVCSHSLVSIPIVMPISSCFEIKVTEQGDKDIFVTADGDAHFRLFKDDVVRVTQSADKLRLIRIKSRNFYEILRQKLEERV